MPVNVVKTKKIDEAKDFIRRADEFLSKFNIDDVIKVINNYFHPEKMNKHFIIIDANL